MFGPYGFIKNLQYIQLRDSHMKFIGKIKSVIPHEQNCGLIGQKRPNNFQ